MIGTPLNFDPDIVKFLESYPYQDIVVPVGNWIANDKGDNIRFGIWSGNNAVGFQNIVMKYAIKDDSIDEDLMPGNIYDIEPGENNLYILRPYTNDSTLKGMVLYGDYYRNPSKDFVLTEEKDVYTVVLFNTETKYFYGLSLPIKMTGIGLVELPVSMDNSIPFGKLVESGRHAKIKLVESVNTGNKYVNVIGSNPFYGIIVVENRILTAP